MCKALSWSLFLLGERNKKTYIEPVVKKGVGGDGWGGAL